MLAPLVLATVCLASSTALATYAKPNYEVESAATLFKHFVKHYNKIYDQKEYSERLAIFKETFKDINERNNKFPKTVFAANFFADLKPHEMQHYYGFRLLNKNITEGKIPRKWPTAPDAFDWREKNAVSPVKNQVLCGSCYIFSAVGNIEGQYAIKHEECLAFSEGQALDCLDCGTCSGGWMDVVMKELAEKKKKLEKAEDYPYEPVKNGCHEDESKGIVQVRTGEAFSLYDEEDMEKELVNYGPLAIAVDANDFSFYDGGILEPNGCGAGLNHGVLLVGYGEEDGKKYWIIKNSWGTDWGEQGYVRMLRGVNACGIGSYVAVSTVE